MYRRRAPASYVTVGCLLCIAFMCLFIVIQRVPVPPLFGLRGTVPLTFQDQKVKNLLSPAVNRSDLRRLNYSKTILGRNFARTPLGEVKTLSQTNRKSRIGRRYLLPILLPSRLRAKGRLVILLNWYPHFLDQSYAPGWSVYCLGWTSNCCHLVVV